MKLARQLDNRPEHLRRSLQHISRARKKQVVIVIDNVDQRDLEVQQSAFVISQELAKNWEALTFIALRPQTFYTSKKSGALSAYPHRVFTIAPPRPELVVKRRLEFAILVAEGKIIAQNLINVRLDLKNVVGYFRVMIRSADNDEAISELFANISGSNIRLVIDLAKNFVGNPNVDAVKITTSEERGENYSIPVHDFSRAAILGDNVYYHPPSSMAANLFDVSDADPREHFLGPLIVSFLLAESTLRDSDGFVPTDAIFGEFQRYGFIDHQIEQCLRRCAAARLTEATERVQFEEAIDIQTANLPLSFRPTNIGAYHVRRWLGTFVYLDAMVFDTPIFDAHLVENLVPDVEHFEIQTRFERATKFRNYLTGVWSKYQYRPTYFDWDSTALSHGDTFKIVERYLEKRAQKARFHQTGRK